MFGCFGSLHQKLRVGGSPTSIRVNFTDVWPSNRKFPPAPILRGTLSQYKRRNSGSASVLSQYARSPTYVPSVQRVVVLASGQLLATGHHSFLTSFLSRNRWWRRFVEVLEGSKSRRNLFFSELADCLDFSISELCRSHRALELDGLNDFSPSTCPVASALPGCLRTDGPSQLRRRSTSQTCRLCQRLCFPFISPVRSRCRATFDVPAFPRRH